MAKRHVLAGAAALWLGLVPAWAQPESPRQEVEDQYHGRPVADPYRWLEHADNPEVEAWAERQNEHTQAHLDPALLRQFTARLSQLWNYTRYSSPFREAGRTFYFRNDGLQNQAVLYEGERPLLDPNTLSADGTTALGSLEVSRDGRYLGYAVSVHGSDQQEIRVRDLSTLRDLDDRIRFCKFSPVAWTADSRGFYYSRFPDPAVTPPAEQNRNSRIYFHQVGTPQAQDVLVYAEPQHPDLGLDPLVTPDGRYLVIRLWRGTEAKNRIYVKDLQTRAPVLKLLDEGDAAYDYVGNDGPRFYFRTDRFAPRGRLVSRELDRSALREILPQQSDAIDFVKLVNDHFVVVTLHDAAHQVRIFAKSGRLVRRIPMPGVGAVADLSGQPHDPEMFLSWSTYVQPTSIYRYDFTRGELSEFRRPEVDFPVNDYTTELTFARSADGTRVPVYLVHRKDAARDGSHPVWLYGYGGFNVNMVPRFSVSRLAWLERGGIVATAVLRGGGEYGEGWHRAGAREHKPNVFADFQAAAQHLVHQGWTRPERLAINGGSNGGLLVAACEVQRPDLYGAVVCQVPVVDMLRYHKFTVGRYWIPEYGNPDDPALFPVLLGYSPLHNVKPARYPATLITTADTDDRVVPMHAKKFAAALQHDQLGDAPILLRVETKAGHGAGKPLSKQIEEAADILAFMFQSLKL